MCRPVQEGVRTTWACLLDPGGGPESRPRLTATLLWGQTQDMFGQMLRPRPASPVERSVKACLLSLIMLEGQRGKAVSPGASRRVSPR